MKQEKILHYYAIFEPAKEGGYNVSFPSFPGCITFGITFEESKEKAKEVLELWLEELQAQNKINSNNFLKNFFQRTPRQNPQFFAGNGKISL